MSGFQRGNIRGAKLKPEQVAMIRYRYLEERGCTQGKLAREYGVTVGTIAGIVRLETWQHVGLIDDPGHDRPPPHMHVPAPTQEELAASTQKLQALLEKPQALPEPNAADKYFGPGATRAKHAFLSGICVKCLQVEGEHDYVCSGQPPTVELILPPSSGLAKLQSLAGLKAQASEALGDELDSFASESASDAGLGGNKGD